MDIATKLTQIAQKEAENIELNNQLEQTLCGVESGGISYYDLFWDNFQQKGALKCYPCAFQKWDESAFYPKYDIIVDANNGTQYGATASMFHEFNSKLVNKVETKEPIDLAQRLEDCGVILDTSRVDSFTYTFHSANVTRIPPIDTRGSSAVGYMIFFNSKNLETIDKLILKDDGSQGSNSNNFKGCTKLKNITIEGVIGKSFDIKDCPLSRTSIESIVSALSTSSVSTLTLKKTAVINAFGSDYDKEGSDWLKITTPKTNAGWSISLA